MPARPLPAHRVATPRRSVPPVDPLRFAPSAERPLRAKLRHLAANTRVDPHSHAWAQVALSSKGVIRMNAGHSTYLVPPQRALWIPPGVEHVVTVVEDAEIRTLYVHQDAQHTGPARRPDAGAEWRQCRVLEVSALLRELVQHLPCDADAPGAGNSPPLTGAEGDERERSLVSLVLDELARARPVRLGVDLPQDKRLRALCEAVLAAPGRSASLEDWARDAGASPRTVARLFRTELGTSFGQWRRQVLLAQALALAARKLPMGSIAAELGYASASAFSAMVRRQVGLPPKALLG